MSVSMVFVSEFLFSAKKCFFRKENGFGKCLTFEAGAAGGGCGTRNEEGKAGPDDPARRAEKMNLV